jgi:translation elongation factor P
MISVTDLRNGTKVELEGGLWECLDYQHQKIGRGGAKVVAKFRNLDTGSIVEKTFNSGEKLQDIFIDYRTMQFLYADGDTFTFMDTETYEQPTLERTQIGEAARFLKENTEVTVDYYQGRALKVTLPNVVASDRRDGPRGQGRHRLRGHQAGPARDRRQRQRPAVHREGHRGARRHAHRRVPGTGMMDVKDLKRLMDAMAAAGVAELELEWDGSEERPGGRVALRRAAAAPVATVAPAYRRAGDGGGSGADLGHAAATAAAATPRPQAPTGRRRAWRCSPRSSAPSTPPPRRTRPTSCGSATASRWGRSSASSRR